MKEQTRLMLEILSKHVLPLSAEDIEGAENRIRWNRTKLDLLNVIQILDDLRDEEGEALARSLLVGYPDMFRYPFARFKALWCAMKRIYGADFYERLPELEEAEFFLESLSLEFDRLNGLYPMTLQADGTLSTEVQDNLPADRDEMQIQIEEYLEQIQL